MLRTLARSCAMFAANAAGSCNTSAAGTPIGNAPLRPVINIAERLKVSELVLGVGRRQAADQVVQHVLIEGLQVGDFLGGLFQLGFTQADALGERPAQAAPPRTTRTS